MFHRPSRWIQTWELQQICSHTGTEGVGVQPHSAGRAGVYALSTSSCVCPAVPAETRSWHKNCISQTSSWSPCSKSCGRGLSLRVSNANQRCELVKESRLCNLRPCEVDITNYIKVASSPTHPGFWFY